MQGPAGATELNGADGVPGPVGPAGAIGLNGAVGPVGPPGLGLISGAIIALPAIQSPPDGFALLGKSVLAYVDELNRPKTVIVKLYQKQ